MSARITVLASGRGSNFDAIARACAGGKIPARIEALLTDREGAGAIEVARKHAIPAEHVPASRMLERVLEIKPDWIVLAGYMRILPEAFIEAFRGPGPFTRILNIHPSLLPAFKGKDAYRQAWEAGVHVTGCTVHLVEYEVDAGPILAQEAFRIDDCRSAEEVEARGLEVEHRLYPATLARLGQWDFSHGRRARVRSS
jgi:phosphoribosylglycinamide formyltransferase-1